MHTWSYMPIAEHCPSVTKTYWDGFNHDVELLSKTWSQKIKPFLIDNLCKTIKQSGMKTSTPNCCRLCLLHFFYILLKIQDWKLLLVCLCVPDSYNMNRLNHMDAFMHTKPHAKNQMHTSVHIWNMPWHMRCVIVYARLNTPQILETYAFTLAFTRLLLQLLCLFYQKISTHFFFENTKTVYNKCLEI